MFRFRVLVASMMVLVPLLAPQLGQATGRALTVADMTLEYAHNPLGIDEPHPLFSWVLASSERAQVQWRERHQQTGERPRHRPPSANRHVL